MFGKNAKGEKMSIIQIKQIVKKIHDTYDKLLDFTDISNFDLSKSDHSDMAVSRGLSAYVIQHLTGCSAEDAARSVTDSSDDNGIDAIFYDSNINCLYVTQAKYDHDGSGEPDIGSIKKFLDGFEDLLETRFEKFCNKIEKRQTEIEDILDSSGLTAKLLLIYTGINKNERGIAEFDQAMSRLNDSSSWVSYEYFTQKELYEILTSSKSLSIDTDIVIREFGSAIMEPPKAFYGQVAASDIGELWKQYGSKLFSSNIRNLLSKSDVNENMLDTLKTAGRLFWYYNNGITIICDSIEKKRIGGTSRDAGTFIVKNLSIVNGAQTTGTLGSFYTSLSEQDVERYLGDSYVQVKVIQTKDDKGKDIEPELGKQITINNNMQNKIVARDFASQTELQKRLKVELEQEDIVYHISRGEDEVSNSTNFSISEAGRARCNTIGIKYVMIAHRGINTYLFKNMDSNEYKAVFNDSITGVQLWNNVILQRAIDEVLKKERKNNTDIREVLIYGKDFLSYKAYCKYWKNISKNEIIKVSNSDRDNIRKYCIGLANDLSTQIKSFDKPTRNVFQSESDVELLNEAIKDKE